MPSKEAAFRKLPIAPPDDGKIPYEWLIPGIGRQLALMKPVDRKVASPDAAKRKLVALKKHAKITGPRPVEPICRADIGQVQALNLLGEPPWRPRPRRDFPMKTRPGSMAWHNASTLPINWNGASPARPIPELAVEAVRGGAGRRHRLG
jgi:hypothetical protein